MPITKEQALEIADKYLFYTGKIVLRDNISVRKSARGWEILPKTTPIILGMPTEITTFPIDTETGEVGVSITQTASITDVLKEINDRQNLDEPKKEQLKAKVEEFKKESTKRPVDKDKMNDLKKGFEKFVNYVPLLKSIIDLINTIVSSN